MLAANIQQREQELMLTNSPGEREILDQLKRIVTSTDFNAGPRTQKLLSHLVRQELAGKGEDLRGTALAMDVFDRDASFDPNSDPVVRIEAVKLRKALEHFYLTSGSDDEISIAVPKGQYRPQFKSRPKADPRDVQVERTGLPTLGVVAFQGPDTPRAILFRDGLPEEICLELARFSQIRVISGWQDKDGSTTDEKPKTIESYCDYLLRGVVRESEDQIRISVQLTRVSTGALVWSERFDTGSGRGSAFEVQEEIAKQCAVRLGDAYGAIAEDVGARPLGRYAADGDVFEALLAFQSHMRVGGEESFQRQVELSAIAVRKNPASGLAHALASLSCIEQVAMGKSRLEEVRETGQNHAERAIALSPYCQEALFAAAVFAQMNGDLTRFDRLITAAVEANPNGTLLTAMAGGWVAIVGNVERGAELVRQAIASNPILPIWADTTLCLHDIVRGDYGSASDKVRYVDAKDCAGEWAIIAAAHALAGEPDLAKAALSSIADQGFDAVDYLRDLHFPTPLFEKICDSFLALHELRAPCCREK